MVWWEVDKWRAMRSGDGCSMCADSHLPSNEHSDRILELGVSVARLHRNQTKPGYVVVILNGHVCELHELDAGRLAQFWDDVAVVGQAVAEAFAPVKIDNLVMGHRCPHLHCHVYPQYSDDDPFGHVDISAGTTRLSQQDQDERVRLLRDLMTANLATRGSPPLRAALPDADVSSR